MRPFVISGCGRSGTMGLSVLLNELGVRTSFEEYFAARHPHPIPFLDWLKRSGTVGEVSSLSPPYLAELREQAPEVLVIHQLRNPVAVMASLVGLETWTDKRWWPNVKFNFRWLLSLANEDDPLVLSAKYWLEWNQLVDDAEPDFRLRSEQLGFGDTEASLATLKELLDLLEVNISARRVDLALAHYDARYNHRPRAPSISWSRIPDSQLKSLILKRAHEYGYTTHDLATYCPAGPDCPHCGGPLKLGQGGYLVHLRPDLPRWMRKEEGSGPPNSNYIQGLIDLYRFTRTHGAVGVEVGCYQGESSEIAAQFLGKLYCVDNWAGSFAVGEGAFDQRMARFQNVHKIKAESHKAALLFKEEEIDIVYIDAMHDYENVYRDICSWFPKVKLGGWITGHDYDDLETHVGVVEAVDELFGQPVHRFPDSSWAFQKTAELMTRFEIATGMPIEPEELDEEEAPCDDS